MASSTAVLIVLRPATVSCSRLVPAAKERGTTKKVNTDVVQKAELTRYKCKTAYTVLGTANEASVMQALFFTYGGMEPNTASVMAEMLGFNPDLVMPQLQRELDVVQQHQADSS